MSRSPGSAAAPGVRDSKAPVGAAAGERFARAFYEFSVAAGALALAWTLLAALGLASIRGPATWLFRALVFRFGLVVAVGLFAVVAVGRAALAPLRPGEGGAAGLDFASSSWLVRGLCASTALAFLATEVGKVAHLSEMKGFFAASGFAAWFLYAVMTVETLGAVGLLVPSVRLVAAGGLSLVMVGAILTHWRKGDPFADSLEAVHLLVTLLCILVLGILRDRAERMRPV
jgi:putative oxidoreductase